MATGTMDAIKKKMQAMRLEKESAFDRAEQLENKLTEQKVIYEKGEEINSLHKRIATLGSDVELARTQLQSTTDKLESTNRRLTSTEEEVQTLTKRVRTLEEEYEQTEGRLQTANEKLELATKTADESERGRRVLEKRNLTDEDRIVQLQRELEATILLGEETDRKFEETSRMLTLTEVDLEKGDARLEAAETKILDLEEQLKIVGNHLKSLEIAEQEVVQHEVVYEQQIASLTSRLVDAESRALEYEKVLLKLQREVDRLEDAVAAEKDKYKSISIDLDTTFTEVTAY